MNTILVLEDAAEVRAWLVGLLRQVYPAAAITEAATLAQALDCVAAQSFDLACIDINLPDGNGLSLLKELRQRSPRTYCVIATILDDDENVFRALREGAQGYLLKDQPDEVLVDNLGRILKGDPPISPPVARRILSYFRKPETTATDPGLSEREREILTLVAKGLNRAEIAKCLGISATTVATHIGAVYRKLKITSRSEAAVEAVRLGLLDL